MKSIFKNPLDPENVQIKALLKNWIIQKLQLSDDTPVSIQEYGCTSAGCVHAETIFTISPNWSASQEFYKISKPLIFIRKWDMDSLQKINTTHTPHQH